MHPLDTPPPPVSQRDYIRSLFLRLRLLRARSTARAIYRAEQNRLWSLVRAEFC